MFIENLSTTMMDLCKEQHLTQEQAAERCGISVHHLNRILRGKATPSLHVLEQIYTELQITPNDLLLSQECKEE